MKIYKQEFIKFMVQSGVLTFGQFKTKSGRQSPFFINTGNYNSGKQIAKLGVYYAHTIMENKLYSANVLYGPAYKGISLCVTTSIALHDKFNHNINFSFNRKEAKDHGETGILVGHKLSSQDKVIIIEDVITAGTALRESIPLIKSFNAQIKAIIIAVDRMEKGQNDISALAEIYQQFNIQVYSIVTIKEIIDYLHNRTIDNRVVINDHMKEKIDAYYRQYGID